MTDNQTIIAYEIYPQQDMPLIPAPITREWMDNTQQRYAYRCLPLTLANQAGWLICNPSSFCVRWNGGPGVEDTTVVFDGVKPDERISSLFGHGTITFNFPYLMRTPPEINLWVKGPTNWPKDGVQTVEGIVETDWKSSSFTMNWKFARSNQSVCSCLTHAALLTVSCHASNRLTKTRSYPRAIENGVRILASSIV
jgi:hypothetical protein